MRFSQLALAAVLALGAYPAFAEDAATAEAPEATESAEAVSQEAPEAEAADSPAALAPDGADESAATDTEEAIAKPIELGPAGVDQHGHAGRIHRVLDGDTLWDISDAYLGTPWVWPSVWEDNDAIADPHLIYPGDHVWISPYDMRKVSEEEAQALMAGTLEIPAAMEDADLMPSFKSRPVFRYTELQTAGFVTMDDFDGAAAIVDSNEHERSLLSDNTEVIIGLGDSEVAIGDQFEIFRTEERVLDPETDKPVGYLTEELGWLEVTAVHEESATAMIKSSRSEIERGDHLLPRRFRDIDIEVMDMPEVAGQVMHTPSRRLELAQRDVIYLNRGSSHGIEVGSPLEIYRPLGDGLDDAQQRMRKLPDHVLAKMIVVDVHDETAVAVLMHTTREITRGDHFRGSEDFRP
jgi:hypothetical protein